MPNPLHPRCCATLPSSSHAACDAGTRSRLLFNPLCSPWPPCLRGTTLGWHMSLHAHARHALLQADSSRHHVHAMVQNKVHAHDPSRERVHSTHRRVKAPTGWRARRFARRPVPVRRPPRACEGGKGRERWVRKILANRQGDKGE